MTKTDIHDTAASKGKPLPAVASQQSISVREHTSDGVPYPHGGVVKRDPSRIAEVGTAHGVSHVVELRKRRASTGVRIALRHLRAAIIEPQERCANTITPHVVLWEKAAVATANLRETVLGHQCRRGAGRVVEEGGKGDALHVWFNLGGRR